MALTEQIAIHGRQGHSVKLGALLAFGSTAVLPWPDHVHVRHSGRASAIARGKLNVTGDYQTRAKPPALLL